MSFTNNDSFISFFPTWMFYISFSCFIAIAMTSSIVVNRKSNSRQHSVALDLRRKAFNISPLNMFVVSFVCIYSLSDERIPFSSSKFAKYFYTYYE